jgi:hypothetical protein
VQKKLAACAWLQNGKDVHGLIVHSDQGCQYTSPEYLDEQLDCLAKWGRTSKRVSEFGCGRRLEEHRAEENDEEEKDNQKCDDPFRDGVDGVCHGCPSFSPYQYMQAGEQLFLADVEEL